jgi:hypothetical protein
MTSSTSSDKLSEARKAFDQWRNNRQKREPIPDELWTMAVQLLEHYPVTLVKRELRLNLTQLRKQQRAILKQKPAQQLSREQPSFIQLNQLLPQLKDPSDFQLHIHREDGASLTVSLPSSQSDLLRHLVTTFIQA